MARHASRSGIEIEVREVTVVFQDILPQIFDPFLTTKDGEYKQLSAVSIKRHSGRIEVKSKAGKGQRLRSRCRQTGRASCRGFPRGKSAIEIEVEGLNHKKVTISSVRS